jgi:flagellar basal-body rod modification protein FlgD
MNSIDSVSPSGVQSGVAATSATPSKSAPAGSFGDTSTFLSLLVAQLKNQDPTNPVDGTAFVTQLAEFNNVEQNLAIREDMDAVSEKYLGTSTPPSQSLSN